VIAAIVLPVVTLAALKWFEIRTAQAAAEKSGLVAHAREVECQIEILLSTVKDLETGSRGYLLAGTPSYLAPYEQAKATLTAQRTRLRSLVTDHPLQVQNLAATDRLVLSKIEVTTELVTRQQNGRRDEALALFLSGECQHVMDDLRLATQRMLEEERRLVSQREASLASTIASFKLFSLLVALGTIILLALFGFVLIRLERAHAYLTICAWSRTVQYEGEWISFEQYLEKRFGIRTSHGISPQEVERFLTEDDLSQPGKPDPEAS